MFECPICYGYRCSHCNETGEWELTECASTFVTPDVTNMIRWVRRAEEKNILPMGPVALDNTESFLQAWDYIRTEEIKVKRHLGIKE